jgi:cell division protein FtsZ
MDNEQSTENIDILPFPTYYDRIFGIIGVGRGGIKAVNNMYCKPFQKIFFMVCDTDAEILRCSPVESKIRLTCNKLEDTVGTKRALSFKTKAQISNCFNGFKMVLIVAGMGGEIGDDLLPEMTRLIRDMNILTVCVVSVPFYFEGDAKVAHARRNIAVLKKCADSIFVVENELLKKLHPDLKLSSAFELSHATLYDISDSIFSALLEPGPLNFDFPHIYYILNNTTEATIGFGVADGDNRVMAAIEDAYKCPLFNSAIFNKAKRYFIMIRTSYEHQFVKEELKAFNSFIEGSKEDVFFWQNCIDNTLNTKLKVDVWVTVH